MSLGAAMAGAAGAGIGPGLADARVKKNPAFIAIRTIGFMVSAVEIRMPYCILEAKGKVLGGMGFQWYRRSESWFCCWW